MTEPAATQLRILLVDDNPDDRLLAERALRAELGPLQVVAAVDPAGFEAALEDERIDLVLTDFRLLWTDGLAVLRAVKQRHPDRPVVMFTGTGSEEIAVEAMRAGLDDYVLKDPRRAVRLGAAVRAALDHAADRRALRASEVRFRELFESVPIGLFRAGPDGTIIDANQALAGIVGAATGEDLRGLRTFEIWLDEGLRQEWRAAMARDGVVVGFEAPIRCLDGHVRWVSTTARASRDAAGMTQWYDGSVLDVTGRRAAELALRESEARKGAMLEASLDAVIAIDGNGLITEFSPAAVRTFGYERADAIGRTLVDLLVPQDLRGSMRAGMERLLRTGHSVMAGRRLELTALRADGEEVPIELTVNRVSIDGPPIFIGYIRDLTDRRALEDQLRQAQKMETMGRFAGGIAHDFNNLLTIITGAASIALADLDVEAPARVEVAEIDVAARRAVALTGQLLAFSRRQHLRPRLLDPNDAVRALAPAIARLVGEQIAVRVELRPNLGAIRVDPGQLDRVILNLAANARDAMPEGGELRIETDEREAGQGDGVPAGRYVVTRIADSGAGMSPATVSRIFEPFFTTKGEGRGSGLGLAVVYGVVHQSGGAIRVASTEGVGTTFEVLLPRVAETAATGGA